MIPRLIEYSVRNRFIVILLTAAVAVWGIYCVLKTPIDAIPDLSENQVIVFTDWMGRAPREIDDQITYPLSVNLQGLAGVKAVRSSSEFNFSMINIIFDDKTDFYFARQRVLERLNVASTYLPQGVVPYLAPDATALGQIFWYTVEGDGKSLDELRAIQDWYVRYQLYVPGVAEVASVGGFVREYQIDVDPDKLRAYDVALGSVFGAVARSNIAVGGKVFFEGRDITKLKTHQIVQLGIGRQFQTSTLFMSLSVLDNVFYGYHLNYKTAIWKRLTRWPSARSEERELRMRGEFEKLLLRIADMELDHTMEMERVEGEKRRALEDLARLQAADYPPERVAEDLRRAAAAIAEMLKKLEG